MDPRTMKSFVFEATKPAQSKNSKVKFNLFYSMQESAYLGHCSMKNCCEGIFIVSFMNSGCGSLGVAGWLSHCWWLLCTQFDSFSFPAHVWNKKEKK